ncbi:MAG TPA: cytochrome C oxidase subunit IV [Cryomorphaceae bacterium]|mgnify:FL=1|jgi:cytochrome c oxidase subunit IV|nr:cytochrome C oxidase subunit IV [Cryomorphaceae bacterium]HBJ71786.1 cytochrome C oxidase subunit IV [Cryomorphaceae bacterium]
MADHASPSGTGWIWKIFWILLAITTVEVVLGIIKPEILLTSLAGTSILNIIFIGLTLVKAAYIVQYFMHLKYELGSLQKAIYLPVLILIPYLTFILLFEGQAIYEF